MSSVLYVIPSADKALIFRAPEGAVTERDPNNFVITMLGPHLKS